MACARCHDHKFDPLKTEDYYALAGVIASTQLVEWPLVPANPEASAALTEVQKVLHSTASDAERAEALAIRGEVISEMGDYNGAVKVLEEAIPLARKGDHQMILARALYGLGDANWRLGNLPKAEAFLNESLIISREIKDAPRTLYAMNRLGTVLTSTPDGMDEAEQIYIEGLKLARQTGNREREMTILNNMGEIIKNRGNLAQATENYRQALALARELGAKSSSTVYLLNMGDASIKLGDVEAGRNHLREALSIATGMGAMPWVLGGIVYFGWLAHAEGDDDRMLQLVGLALNHPAKFNDLEQEVNNRLPGYNLPEKTVKAGMAKGAKLDFETTVRDLIGDLVGVGD